MRILFVSASSGSRGGGEIYLVYLGAALRARGHEVGLWISDHPRMDELAERFAAVCGEVMRSSYPWFYDSWHRGVFGELTTAADHRRWADEWRKWTPDIVHFNKQCLEDGLDLLHAARALALTHLATIHITQTAQSLRARFGVLRDWRARRALRKYPSPLIAVSAARGTELRHFLGQQARIEMIDNGVPIAPPCTDREALRVRERIPPNTFAVVAVGRLEAQKNPLRFLREIDRLRKTHPNLTARWIGGGRLQSAWDATRRELGLESVVTQDEWRDDVGAVLPAFDLFLHTANFEGLPLALLEAMGAGLPAAVASGVRDQLPGHLRENVVPIDADLSGFIASATAREALAFSGQQAVRGHHSVEAMAAQYEQLYASLQPVP